MTQTIGQIGQKSSFGSLPGYIGRIRIRVLHSDLGLKMPIRIRTYKKSAHGQFCPPLILLGGNSAGFDRQEKIQKTRESKIKPEKVFFINTLCNTTLYAFLLFIFFFYDIFRSVPYKCRQFRCTIEDSSGSCDSSSYFLTMYMCINLTK